MTNSKEMPKQEHEYDMEMTGYRTELWRFNKLVNLKTVKVEHRQIERLLTPLIQY